MLNLLPTHAHSFIHHVFREDWPEYARYLRQVIIFVLNKLRNCVRVLASLIL